MKPLAYLLAVLLCASSASAQQPPGPKPTPRAAPTAQRVRLAPQLAPGSVLRYQMESRTTTESHRTGLVEDPQAPSQLAITWGAVVRLEVLSVGPDVARHPAARTRLRTTYEKSVATARSDTYDPEAAALEEQYRKLEGRTIQFTLDAQGKVSEAEGLQEILSDQRAASAAREWLGELAAGAALPAEGIAPGQQWSAERPATSAPLAGIVWRTHSTYLRNEPCRPADPARTAAAAAPEETCAVILTRFEMTQPHAPRDPTPEEYRKSGLRTAGKWTGSGESLSYVSLRTGWVVSVTQSGAEEMDVTVASADGEARVRYAGRVRSQSQITLLPESTPPPH
ncbi:MAG: hypothetical protein HY237_01605 [Acidobacteria bacterium]|nr:hypothetical protein [Acidobacteriota bacterium]